MNDPLARLLTEHHQCDTLLNDAEDAARRRKWLDARQSYTQAEQGLLAHFELEETRLFPAFEQAIGTSRGPTAVMREEHIAMREMLDYCRVRLEQEDGEGFQAEIDTLFVLIQQHNVKEENVLYPMCRARVPGLEALMNPATSAAP